MDEIEIFDTPVANAGDMGALLLRFLFNSVFIWIIIQKLYYPKSQRRDYYFSFCAHKCEHIFPHLSFGERKDKGRFPPWPAIFGIIRYRTESMSVREMTYLFVIIAVSVINALGRTLSYGEPCSQNAISSYAYACARTYHTLNRGLKKFVVYDRIDLIKPDCRDELPGDLKTAWGDIIDVEVGAVDFLGIRRC